MARSKPPVQLTLTIALDGETVDLGVSSDQSVREVLKTALLAFGAIEDPDDCHLADGNRLIFPFDEKYADQTLSDVGIEGSGGVLSLRLPF